MNKKMKMLVGAVRSAEMSVKEIPVSDAVDVEQLKKGDDDPLEVVVEIPVSTSTKGWYYTHDALRDIVDAVNERTLHGFLGHQKEEDIDTEFPDVVTHWVGAKMTENAAYFRGVVDASASKLKRLIRSGTVRNVSIFGDAFLAEDEYGQNIVVGYEPMSIDWTPLERMGMPTRVVAVGEMAEYNKSKEEKPVTPEELLRNLKTMHNNRQITPKMIGDALGVDAVTLAGEMDSTIKVRDKELTEVKKKLNISGEMSVVGEIEKLQTQAKEYEAIKIQKAVGEMAEKHISIEGAAKDLTDEKTPLGKLWKAHLLVNPAETEADMEERMKEFVADDATKALIETYKTEAPAVLSGEMNSRRKKETPTYKVARETMVRV